MPHCFIWHIFPNSSFNSQPFYSKEPILLSECRYFAKNWALVLWWNFSWPAMIVFSFINSFVRYKLLCVLINSCFWKFKVHLEKFLPSLQCLSLDTNISDGLKLSMKLVWKSFLLQFLGVYKLLVAIMLYVLLIWKERKA